MSLLNVEDLRVHFRTPDGINRAVNGVSLKVEDGETLAIVGESGCGKSVTAMSILRLVASPPAATSGRIMFEGADLLSLPEKKMRDIRGGKISMIFQDPMSSLNPVMTIGDQLGEAMRIHRTVKPADIRSRSQAMLALVGIPDPARRIDEYPHQLSGGMRQRAMIAIALACNPKLVIADEPTTALDVTVQAQVLDLMRSLKESTGTAIILITHDLGVVAEMAQKVMVMYAGRTVEQGDVEDLFANPHHPYTIGLLNAVPHRVGGEKQARLADIPGSVPSLKSIIQGCVFADRCYKAAPMCREVAPVLEEKSPGHLAACHFPEGVAT